MAITLSTAARNAAANAISDLIDVGGTTNPEGRLRIMTAATAGTTLVTVPFAIAAPGAFAAASNGSAASNGAISAVATATGTASHFDIIDRGGAIIISGTVSASGGGGDIILSRTAITSGDTISFAAGAITFTVPAT